MGFLKGLYNQISSNNIFATLFVGGLISWIFYRINRSDERKTLIESLKMEIEFHSYWLSAEYPRGFLDDNWVNIKKTVFKLSAVAIDSAIEKGPSIFFDRTLFSDLVLYRQLLSSFNQLVEAAQTYQSNIDLWKSNPDKEVISRMIELIASIHWNGIGDKTNINSAHSVFIRVNRKLDKENSYKIISFFWLIFGINILSVFKYNNMNVIKFLRVYFNYYLFPTCVLLVAVVGGYFTINWYWANISNSANSNTINLLIAEAIITFIATSSGLLIPLLISHAQNSRAERRSLAFTLGLVWNELRINRTYLVEIKNFYKFDEHFKLTDFSRKLTELYIMIRALNTLVNKIDNSSFIASQNSGSIVKLDTDELLNSITQAYENISYFKFSLNIVFEDLNVKYDLHKINEYKKEILQNKTLQEEVSEKIKLNLQNCFKELNDAIMIVNLAIENADKRLNKLGITVEEEVKKI